MRFILIAAGLFAAGASYNFFSSSGDIVEGAAGLAIAAALTGLWRFLREQDKRNREFLTWLSLNAGAIASGGSRYKDVLITKQTEITQYQAALSFLIITIKAPSRFLIVGHGSNSGIAFLFSIASLIFGWWGIPWGPVYTVQSLFKNLKGGYRQTVGDILARIQAIPARSGVR